jgi:transcriptional regulator with XRE-family HTH domain
VRQLNREFTNTGKENGAINEVDVSVLIRQRLRELGLEQKQLAEAAQVTESYVSQLLARKKAPPTPGRTDIYEKIGAFLNLPGGELAALAENERRQELRKKIAAAPRPLLKDCRDLILKKCDPDRREEVRRIFEKEAFGELERLVTQKVLDVAQGLAREELRSEEFLRSVARLSGRSYEQMRVAILEFLDTDIFDVSREGCVTFLDPMIDSWDIDLKTFGMEIILNPRLAAGSLKRFEFVEVAPASAGALDPGFEQFLRDGRMSSDITPEEIEILRALKFKDRRPSPLFYYRALQNLRDPLHFQPSEHQ